MKKCMMNILFLMLVFHLFAQQTPSRNTLSREDYLIKSKKQKTGAWVFIGGSVALIGTGILVSSNSESIFEDDFQKGGVLIFAGIISGLASIPLFVASGRNKRKSMQAKAFFQFRKSQFISQHGISSQAIPHLTVRVPLMQKQSNKPFRSVR